MRVLKATFKQGTTESEWKKEVAFLDLFGAVLGTDRQHGIYSIIYDADKLPTKFLEPMNEGEYKKEEQK